MSGNDLCALLQHLESGKAVQLDLASIVRDLIACRDRVEALETECENRLQKWEFWQAEAARRSRDGIVGELNARVAELKLEVSSLRDSQTPKRRAGGAGRNRS